MEGISSTLLHITPAIKYLNIVIPAKAGIQEGTGCRIKSGMTELDYLIARLIIDVTPWINIILYAEGRVLRHRRLSENGYFLSEP